MKISDDLSSAKSFTASVPGEDAFGDLLSRRIVGMQKTCKYQKHLNVVIGGVGWSAVVFDRMVVFFDVRHCDKQLIAKIGEVKLIATLILCSHHGNRGYKHRSFGPGLKQFRCVVPIA